ncbi:hypothetical protein PG989_013604 [Apiospora arundinis]
MNETTTPEKTRSNSRRRGPKVVIVGGGTMGLALALMLDLADDGIDYAVLEVRDAIAPQAGAGIAIFPNAYRILDQLGLYERFAATSVPLERLADWWAADGSPNAANEGLSSIFRRVFGYPLIVMDRQQAIRNMYDAIRDKSKIHTGKTVVEIDSSDEGAIKCNWAALFGIAELKGLKIEPGASLTAQKGQTIAIMSGKDRAYMVHNTVLPRELKGSKIRRFTEEEREKYVAAHASDLIQNGVTFGDLYKNRIRSAYVPLQQYVLKHWHFGRVLLLGDTVHKTHPVTGMGAAMCMEDAAVFVNILTAHVDTGLPLGSEQVEQLFRELERLRVSRSTKIVNQSFQAQSMQSWQNPFMKLFYMYVMPWLGVDFVLAQAMKGNCVAPRLERLPVPDRQALVGFNDVNPEPRDPVRLLFKWSAFGILLLSAFTTTVFGQAIPSLSGPTVVLPSHINGLLVVMLVEGWRRSNTLSLSQWPVLWTVLGDFLLGWKRTIPLFLLDTYSTRLLNGRFQYTAPSLPMVLSAAHAIPIALIFANAIPSAMLELGFLPWKSLPPPATVAALVVSVSALLRIDRSIPSAQEGAALQARVSAFFKHHVGYLCTLYAVAFIGLTYMHRNVVGFSFPSWSTTAVLTMMGHHLADLAFLVGTVSEVCFYTGLGRWVPAYAAIVPVALFYLGPGSVYAAVWFWRETRLARTSTRGKSGQSDNLK